MTTGLSTYQKEWLKRLELTQGDATIAKIHKAFAKTDDGGHHHGIYGLLRDAGCGYAKALVK